MFRKLKPDYTFNAYFEVTPDFLRREGIRALLIDIDNTLAPYEQDEPDERLTDWLGVLAGDGVRIALISNNCRERVRIFNRSLGLPAYPESGKPRKKYLRAAIAELNASVRECAVLGDQLFTDAYAGKRLGMRAIIVPPINDKKTVFFRFKRSMEKPIMRSYEREQAKKNGPACKL